jgi:4-amino-4-deoxychorismate lyase
LQITQAALESSTYLAQAGEWLRYDFAAPEPEFLPLDGIFFSRAASYGDGVFETMRSCHGRLPLLDAHLDRLARGLQTLGLAVPARAPLAQALSEIAKVHCGVLKLRASSSAPERGYRRAHDHIELLLSCHPLPDQSVSAHGLCLRICRTTLADQPALAGLKSLNRLEQILAANEAESTLADEGLMVDAHGNLVCATSANLFVVLNNVLVTPTIARCGVRGVMRATLLALCKRHGIAHREAELRPDDLARASEVFLSNAVRGVRPVGRLLESPEIVFAAPGVIAQQLSALLNQVGFGP